MRYAYIPTINELHAFCACARTGSATRADDNPPLADQLTDLGRQALAQGAGGMAGSFFQKALQLDPGNAEATKGLAEAKAAGDRLVKVALQDAAADPAAPTPTPPPAPPPGGPGPTPPGPPPRRFVARQPSDS